MSVRSVLAAEGLVSSPKKAMYNEAEAQFDRALQGLIEAAGLPPIRITGFAKQRAQIVVPRGFDSMFKELWIELSIQKANWGLWGQLSWKYEHPGGGTNGVTIGTISVKEDDLEAGWRLETGEFKKIPPPRFPADPL